MTVAELMKIVEEPRIQGRRIAGGRLQMRDEDWKAVKEEMMANAGCSFATHDGPPFPEHCHGMFMGVQVFIGYSETRFVEGLPD